MQSKLTKFVKSKTQKVQLYIFISLKTNINNVFYIHVIRCSINDLLLKTRHLSIVMYIHSYIYTMKIHSLLCIKQQKNRLELLYQAK